ncbi:response regulator transcription factor [Caballeronia sp. LZ035]|uniref:response regulator transcription factor n=1 Tax=Caballeronia sp. LZ035 TaxID=3038568 RepID=UPI00285530D7|nr:response regulator transcription factor [Caballeronia sp. LZ035]MDR5756514.1 response regulator transcription factor [Caballeronia sp. LZ035]
MAINVITAESHPITALGLEAVLRRCHGVNLLATISKGHEFSQVMSAFECHVVVTDREAACGVSSGTSEPLIKVILEEHPNIGVVLHSCVRNAAYVSTLCQLGVHAVLDKDDVLEYLPAAITAAHAKASYVSPKLTDPALLNTRSRTDVRPLSRCEVVVIKAVLSGSSVKQISMSLFRSKQTISTHKKNAMRKLQVDSEAELFRVFSETDFSLMAITVSRHAL